MAREFSRDYCARTFQFDRNQWELMLAFVGMLLEVNERNYRLIAARLNERFGVNFHFQDRKLNRLLSDLAEHDFVRRPDEINRASRAISARTRAPGVGFYSACIRLGISELEMSGYYSARALARVRASYEESVETRAA